MRQHIQDFVIRHRGTATNRMVSNSAGVMPRLYCMMLAMIALAGCHTVETVDLEKPSYGRIYADFKSARLPGDVIDLDVWITTLESANDRDGATLAGVPVDFVVQDPTVVRIVGSSKITTARQNLIGPAVARVQLEFLKEGSTTLNASVAGASYVDPTGLNSGPLTTTVALSAQRPTSIVLTPAAPIFIESRATRLDVAAALKSSSGVNISYFDFKWTCPQGEAVVAFSGTQKCNDTMGVANFVPRTAGTTTFRVAVADALYTRFPVFSDLQVTVTNPVARIDLAAGPLSVGSSVPVTATLRDASGAILPSSLRHSVLSGSVIENLDWFTSDPSVATVDKTGLVTGKAADTVTITARYYDVRSDVTPLPVFASASIKFSVGPTSNIVTVVPSSFSMVVGASRVLAATVKDATGKDVNAPITWLSRDVSIANTTIAGGFDIVQAISTGPTTTTPSATVQILARAAGAQGVANVTVYRKVASIILTPPSITLRTGQTARLTPTLLDGSGNVIPTIATKLTWTALDATTATVDTSGLVTAVAPNALPARIRVSDPGGASTTADITVLPPVSTVSLAIQNGSTTRPVVTPEAVAVGGSAQLVATLKDANGATITDALTFTTSSAAIAKVTTSSNTTATISGIAPGTATIRVARTSDPGAFATATFVVSGALGGPATHLVISSTPSNATTTVGGTVAFVAAALDAAGVPSSDCPIGWATDASSVASIFPDGYALGVGAGTTAVRAYCTDHSNISAAARITVTNSTGVSGLNITPRFVYLASGGMSQLYTAALSPSGNTTAVDWVVLQSPANVLSATPSGANNSNITIALPSNAGSSIAGSARIVARAGGQSDTAWVTYGNAGSIKGTAVSASGQYLGGLTATAVPTNGGTAVTSGVNNEGIFYLVGLPAGTYTVTVRQQGNPTAQTITNVIVTAGGTALLSLTPFP